MTHALTPAVSVIIPTYNDASRLRYCLQALATQTLSRDSFEVIVVDNGSTDDTSAVLEEFPWVHAAREERPGSYAARNRGLELARGDLLAFTDSDCIPEPDWLECALAHMQAHPEHARIAGRITVFFRDPDRPTGVELYEAMHAFPQERYAAQGFGATANMVTRRSVFEAVGPFDEALMSGGDNEWGRRAMRSGAVIVFADNVSVRHPARRTIGELHRKTMRVHMADWSRTRRASRREWLVLLGRSLRPPARTVWRARRHALMHNRMNWARYALGATMSRYDGAWATLRTRIGSRGR